MIEVACTIVFLFTLFILSKDDFVLMRRNVSQRLLFDIACVSGVVGLFFARLVYVAMNPSIAYFNPLVFFIIPYFPGISTAGFLFGMCLSVYIFAVRKKLPIGKVFDIVALSLVASGEIYFLIQAVIEVARRQWLSFGVFAACFVLLLIIYILLRKLTLSNRTKDGSVTLIGLASLCSIVALSQLSVERFHSFPKELPYFLILLLILFISFVVRVMRKQDRGNE